MFINISSGDVECKPFVSADADCTEIKMEGTEDLICIACDGFWDVYKNTDLSELVKNENFRFLIISEVYNNRE